jgi:hypothetical protein
MRTANVCIAIESTRERGPNFRERSLKRPRALRSLEAPSITEPLDPEPLALQG